MAVETGLIEGVKSDSCGVGLPSYPRPWLQPSSTLSCLICANPNPIISSLQPQVQPSPSSRLRGFSLVLHSVNWCGYPNGLVPIHHEPHHLHASLPISMMTLDYPLLISPIPESYTDFCVLITFPGYVFSSLFQALGLDFEICADFFWPGLWVKWGRRGSWEVTQQEAALFHLRSPRSTKSNTGTKDSSMARFPVGDTIQSFLAPPPFSVHLV